ncbi:Plasmid related protein OS=Planctomyces brasiliensis (strain ATCC 49424 / DSM 5305 / JCM 21570 / NBRC 103401 / IFAM 1448) GN=Plabr_0950 PE=4 SV=1 [Gemmataceae bacterium]|nr:Plasmid related protein OS=Planctomyces brasiliensis (strain ATCC 49424 / DSM 5305 / JCM 21570 / NBRC 103401 / IFAM 1448) GN=Plabr_0950 PE=4 SV=1 [Gemmataceae bacterium]VTT96342.1 Plasmid related protein OS=Planctomyces brasiliensis (strain ATCC 49424 / DSM 5305 / JCM 21570 / NBRC 103401 / IFAM 1448) GN=Plabr_0950 PE=4 SV=1 [Gemmataceae bacterium]
MNATDKPLFPLGQLAATPAALAALAATGQTPTEFLRRHQCGEYGVVNDEDKRANDDAVRCGERVFSAYLLTDGVKVWVITEADRSSSTVLLPSDY